MEGLELKQGEVVKHGNPLIVPQYPWEGILTYLYGSILQKGKIYRMWYQAHGIYVSYARSRDGIHWEKPLIRRLSVGKPEMYPTVTTGHGEEDFSGMVGKPFRGKTNVVLDFHMPSVIYDPEDRYRPYKLFGYTDKGYAVAFSRDGIHFREYDHNPVIPLMRFPDKTKRKTWFSDVSPVFRDSLKKKFVAHVKTYKTDAEGRIRRCVGYAESEDFLHWSKPETLWVPSESEDQLAIQKGFQWADFYGLCGFNYGHIYLGLLWLFYIDYEIEKGTHEGKIEVYLAYSLDGKKWERFSDAPLIPLSASGWDTGMVTTANLPLFEEDEILLYYGGSNFSHGVGEGETPYDEKNHRFNIGLAYLRKDGFVYACSRGHLWTKPLKSERGYVKINADTREGRILIDMIKNGRKAKSFAMAGTDALDYTVRTHLNENVVLKVYIEDAKLYSLEVL